MALKEIHPVLPGQHKERDSAGGALLCPGTDSSRVNLDGMKNDREEK